MYNFFKSGLTKGVKHGNHNKHMWNEITDDKKYYKENKNSFIKNK